MLRYAARRLITSVLTLFLMITLTFFLMQLVPGGPFLGENVSKDVVERLLAKYGFDRPLFEQYGDYLKNLFKGDLGVSIVEKAGKPVNEIIEKGFPISLKLGFMALGLAMALGIPLGALAATKHNSLFDRVFIFFASFCMSVPSFIMTVAMMLIFGVWLRVLPVAYLESWKSYIMPVVGMSLSSLFSLARLTRTSMLDVTSQDYIKTARAKGLSTVKVIFKHAFRNAVLPVITVLGPMAAGVLTGSFVVEKVFAIPGVGKYFVGAIGSRDYPLIMGTAILYGALLIFSNYIVDLLYGIIDPRIKL
ncbi:MAG: ABC transporter permease [Clostridia bacterium]|nr:ABC transporter permease [Clostridia bacterium]